MSLFNKIIKSNSCYLILEAGINHNGNINSAIKLVNHAKKTKANAIKFQYFDPRDLYLEKSKNIKVLEKYYLSKENIIKIKNYCNKKKIDFLCTAYSKKSFSFLDSIGLKAHKIASMDNNNLDLIKFVANFKKTLLISTGMLKKDKLIDLVDNVKNVNHKLILLHCISNYPTIESEINLSTIFYIKKLFPKLPVGFSDHSLGNDVMKLSLFYNVKVIEKHFTFDKKLNGADHKMSINYKDVNNFLLFEKLFKESYGKNILSKNVIRPDIKNVAMFRKGLYYSKNLNKNEFLSDNIIEARPQYNLSVENRSYLLNKKLSKNVKKLNPIKLTDFK
jgi:N,N'-diacetyllegionaminate synthase